MNKYKIGDILGSNNSLLIIGKVKCTVGTSEKLKYKVQCQICKNDSKLFGEAIYFIFSEYFNNGKLPCGCSKSMRYSEEQWKLIVNRKANKNNHKFTGFSGGSYLNQHTKLNLKCNTCNCSWNSCSIVNYLRGKSCPDCAKIIIAKKHTTSDTDWIFRFMSSGSFAVEQHSFERIAPTGRLWKVRCSICGDRDFISDRSNLIAGKVPCNCGTGGGFDVNKVGYFYLLKIRLGYEIFIKYGISNFYKRRIQDHTRALKNLSGQILEKSIFTSTGKVVLNIESELKRNIPALNISIDGFRKESCHLDYYSKIIDTLNCESAIEKVSINS